MPIRPFAIRHSPIRYSLIVFALALGAALGLLPLKLGGLIVGGSALLILSLHTPKSGLYLLIPAIPFSSLLQLNVAGVNIGPTEALFALIMASWLLQMMARREIFIPHPPMLWPFLLFLGAIALSWLTTFSLNASLIETLKWVEMLAIYLFITANFVRQESRWLVVVLLLSGLAQAGLGLYQFIFKVGPEGFLLFGGQFLRAYGTFQQPNPYAGYLGLILPLALAIFLWAVEKMARVSSQSSPPSKRIFTAETQRHREKIKKNSVSLRLSGENFLAAAQQDKWYNALFWLILSGVALGAGVAALFASQSRGGWLGFAGGALIVILLKGGKWTAIAATGLIAGAILISMGALALLPASILERFIDILPFITLPDISAIPLTDANFATIERLAHWQSARAMWRDHLWLGVGFGNYEAIYAAYSLGRWIEPLYVQGMYLHLSIIFALITLIEKQGNYTNVKRLYRFEQNK
ncbi:MAG: hypothetical protein B6243_02265 [Anaerolineaceae bacterium 4572_5.2]|nr:MAG: hypothetical protein B6243_02265 [Anaerolineaceae bacterium 4572_5.2]